MNKQNLASAGKRKRKRCVQGVLCSVNDGQTKQWFRPLLAVVLMCHSLSAVSGQENKNLEKPQPDSAPSGSWLRLENNRPVIRLQGEVFMPDGQPASDIEVSVEDEWSPDDAPVDVPLQAPVKVDGHRICLETAGTRQLVTVTARTRDGTAIGSTMLPADALRELANTGFRINMAPARTVISRIEADGKPLAGFKFTLRTNSSRKLVCDGVIEARFELAAGDHPNFLMIENPEMGVVTQRIDTSDPGAREAREFIVAWRPTRPMQVRCVDENDQPIPNLPVFVNVYARSRLDNNHRQSGRTTADARGNAVCEIEAVEGEPRYGISPVEESWESVSTLKTDNGLQATFKRVLPWERQAINGTVRMEAGNPAGLLVQLESFQHPKESRMDVLYGRVRPDGTFSADVLVGATYVMTVMDRELVTEPCVGIPAPEEGEAGGPPELMATMGEPLDLVVTAGVNSVPLPDLWIWVSREVPVEWNQDGERSSGRMRIEKGAGSDASGIARVFVSAGTVTISAVRGNWRESRTVEIKKGETNRVEINCPDENQYQIRGQLTSLVGESPVANARIIISAADGKTREDREIRADDHGNFSTEFKGSRATLLAVSSDGKASGATVVELPQTEELQIAMKATSSLAGQLLGVDDQPSAGEVVRLRVEMDAGKQADTEWIDRTVVLEDRSTRSDEKGNYRFDNVPAGVQLRLASGDSIAGHYADHMHGERMLEPGEERTEVLRTGPLADPLKDVSLATRLQSHFRDCQLSDFHGLVIVSGDVNRSGEFVKGEVLNGDELPSVNRYQPIWLRSENVHKREDYQAEFSGRGWTVPGPNEVLLIATDPSGKELERMTVDVTDEASMASAKALIEGNQPPVGNARARFDEAIIEAKHSEKKVWAIASGPRCAPCTKLARWIDANRALLERDFVFVKVNDPRDPQFEAVSREIMGDDQHGIPFFAILDGNGTRVADSVGPLGNIGFPASVEGMRQMELILAATASRLSADERSTLVESLVR